MQSTELIEPHPFDNARFVPYRLADGTARHAVIIKPEVDISHLTENEVQVIGLLSEAVERMQPIMNDQFEPKTEKIHELLDYIISLANDSTKASLENYRTLLHIQSSPYELLKRINVIPDIHPSIIEEIVLGTDIDHPSRELYGEVRNIMFQTRDTPPHANFYPEDMTPEELEGLGDQKSRVNSLVIRNKDGSLEVKLSEKYYAEHVAQIIPVLEKASTFADDPSLKTYIDAKVQELKTGSIEDRRAADIALIKNTSRIKFNLSTALEVYLDHNFNLRGSASGLVGIVDESKQKFMEALMGTVEALEKNAPWKLKKTEIDPSALPKLSFLEVINHSADYNKGPMNTVAQNLPNDPDLQEKYGTVNFLYANITDGINKVNGPKIAELILPSNIAEQVRPLYAEASNLHFMMHELGHATGTLAEEHKGKTPGELLPDGLYSTLEELRAELFALHSFSYLREQGIISQELEMAGYYQAVASFVASLRFAPQQAHSNARNMLIHYALEKGGIETKVEDDTEKFYINPKKFSHTMTEMLGVVGDIKSFGDVAKGTELRDTYCFIDPRQEEIAERTKSLALGRGFFFPELVKEGEKYTSEPTYAPSYDAQNVFKHKLIK